MITQTLKTVTLDNLHTLNGHKPNFTIMVPGNCNAKCGFCFWNHEDGKIVPPKNYLELLEETLLTLPEDIFPAVSLTGGEPTISKYIGDIAKVVRETRKWSRIVLTSNGTKLGIAPTLGVTNVNLSRHHYNDADNNAIFKNKMIGTEDIQSLCTEMNITINCVINDKTDKDFILRMVDFSIRVGAKALSFRREASNVDKTPIENEFINLFEVKSDNKCPVCRTTNQVIFGFPVAWKATHPEPSMFLGSLYEGIFHPDGKIYADWKREMPIDLISGKYVYNLMREKLKQVTLENNRLKKSKEFKVHIPKEPRSYCGSSGCGAYSFGRTSCGS